MLKREFHRGSWVQIIDRGSLLGKVGRVVNLLRGPGDRLKALRNPP
jgi:hypothetical protein